MIRKAYWLTIGVAVAVIVLAFCTPTVKAQTLPICTNDEVCGGHGHSHDHAVNVFDRGNDNAVAGFLVGAAVMCGIVSAIRGRWCWQFENTMPAAKADPEPLNVAPPQTQTFTVRPAP